MSPNDEPGKRSTGLQYALRRAIERRFGKSVLPYKFDRPIIDTDDEGRERHRITDLESGSWVIVAFHPGDRIRVVAE